MKIRVIYFFFFSFFISANLFAQQIVFTTQCTEGYAVYKILQDQHNEYYVLVEGTDEYPEYTSRLAKFNKYGELLWMKKYYQTGGNFIIPRDMLLMPDGELFILLSSGDTSFISSKSVLSKLSSNGDVLWSKEYSNNLTTKPNKIILTNNKQLYISYYDGPQVWNTTNADAGIMKLDTFGNIIWVNTFHVSSQSEGAAIKIFTDDSYVLSGYEYGGMFFMKGDSSGNNISWNKKYTVGASHPWVSDFLIQSDKSILGIGQLYFPNFTNPDEFNAIIFKLDTVGHVIWMKYFDIGTGDGIKVMYRWDGKIQFFIEPEGYEHWPCHSKSNIFSGEMDEEGNIYSAKFYDRDRFDRIWTKDFIETSDSGILFASASVNPDDQSHYETFTLVKADKFGSTNCNDTLVDLPTVDTSVVVANNSLVTYHNMSMNLITIKTDNIVSAVSTSFCFDSLFNSVSKNNIIDSKFNPVLFPNPASNKISIRLNKDVPAQYTLLEVFDILGKKIKTETEQDENEISINTSILINGIYFFKISLKGNNLSSGKFIVTH